MSEKTATEIAAMADYLDTRGRAAAQEAGLAGAHEIEAFRRGAEWMAEEIERTYILTPRPQFVRTKDGLIPLDPPPR